MARWSPLLRGRCEIYRSTSIKGTDVLQNPANANPIGTGAFKFKEWNRGAQVTLVKNDRYFKPGLPTIDQVVFRVLPQAALSVIALERGEVDFLASVPAADVARLRANSNLSLAPALAGPGGSFCISTMIPNLTRAPLDNLKVRQAIFHTINRDFIVLAVLGGLGHVATAPISRGITWANHPSLPHYRYDATRANTLLDEAGFRRGPDGTRFRLTYVAATTQIRYAEVVRASRARPGCVGVPHLSHLSAAGGPSGVVDQVPPDRAVGGPDGSCTSPDGSGRSGPHKLGDDSEYGICLSTVVCGTRVVLVGDAAGHGDCGGHSRAVNNRGGFRGLAQSCGAGYAAESLRTRSTGTSVWRKSRRKESLRMRRR